jgi:hypothetical protein
MPSFRKLQLQRKITQYSSQVIGEYGLGAGASNYLDIICQYVNICNPDKELIKRIAELVWKDRQSLFGTNTAYEIVLLGITLYFFEFNARINEVEYSHFSETSAYYKYYDRVSRFIRETIKGDFKKNMISVYQTVLDIFPINEPRGSVEKILIDHFNLTKSQKERLQYIQDIIIPRKRAFFNRLHSENILLGALLYVYGESECSMDFEMSSMDVDGIISALHADNHEYHLAEVREVLQMIQELCYGDFD